MKKHLQLVGAIVSGENCRIVAFGKSLLTQSSKAGGQEQENSTHPRGHDGICGSHRPSKIMNPPSKHFVLDGGALLENGRRPKYTSTLPFTPTLCSSSHCVNTFFVNVNSGGGVGGGGGGWWVVVGGGGGKYLTLKTALVR
ncbi:hypothetical protein DPMN_189904 [Dreissena polymorpha]|uniref:Uncharacterized protein n=1 Tax=Dreissena polymorpha TaxID=45954 RepID=A0A9D4IBG4_DREPO|nr:hypothetical protein DPMN_189904 [Dreissena polymorpha]